MLVVTALSNSFTARARHICTYAHIDTWKYKCHGCYTCSNVLTAARLPSSDSFSNALPCSSTDNLCLL